MNIKYKMVVDFARPHHSNTVLVQRTDDMSRELEFTLMNNGKEFDMSDVSYATVQAVLPNGEYVTADAEIEVNEEGEKTNRVSYQIPAKMTRIAGSVTVSMVLTGENKELITSFESYIIVRNVLYSSSDIDMDDLDLSGFRDLLNEAVATANRAWSAVKDLNFLPNPEPIRITVDDTTYSYNGSELVEVEDLASKAWIDIEINTKIQEVMNGCTIYYRDGYFWATYGSVVKKLGDVSSLGLTAEASNVLVGKTFLGDASMNADEESVMTGTMQNNGAVNKTLSWNEVYTIPEGYHDGTGKVRENIIANIKHKDFAIDHMFEKTVNVEDLPDAQKIVFAGVTRRIYTGWDGFTLDVSENRVYMLAEIDDAAEGRPRREMNGYTLTIWYV